MDSKLELIARRTLITREMAKCPQVEKITTKFSERPEYIFAPFKLYLLEEKFNEEITVGDHPNSVSPTRLIARV